MTMFSKRLFSILKQHQKRVVGSAIILFLFLDGLILIHNSHIQTVSNPFTIISYHPNAADSTLFPVQCIDTMKVSRDKAKENISVDKQIAAIQKELKEISSLGANCVAVGTPYDDEFLPYLKLWVAEARKQQLHVWFRGNWSSWEGWFGHPKSMTTDDHIKQTVTFIKSNPDLFADGDIFTAAPEAENGAPFNPVDSAQKYTAFRNFLKAENLETQKAFQSIHKNVTTNWLSMSGGVAEAVLNQSTIANMDNTVTLDHYVKDPQEVTSYLDYFQKNYHSSLVLGEFGAPIPDLNGSMTEDQQAVFVDKLLQILYQHKNSIKGVNYWTLSESSTALLNSDGKEKVVTAVLKKYYRPARITGVIKNTNGNSISNIQVRTQDLITTVKTNKNGEFELVIPAVPTTLVINDSETYSGESLNLSPEPNELLNLDIRLSQQKIPLFYRIKAFFTSLI